MRKICNTMFILISVLLSFLSGCSKKAQETSSNPVLASVKIDSAFSISTTSAIVTASLTKEAGTIKRKGICWGVSHNATIDSSHNDNDPTLSSGWIFSSNLYGMLPNTVYFVKAYVVNDAGVAYSGELSLTTKKGYVVFGDSTTFGTVDKFENTWNYLYPWGSDHNGTARMFKSQIVVSGGMLTITANKINTTEGNSTATPYLPIRYHSGAIHFKQMITVTDSLPNWIVSGDFQAPVSVGTWPAFWITGVDNWPPESDIMEFKGDSTVWQNTITGPNWQNVNWATNKSLVNNASSQWHNYKVLLNRVDAANLALIYFIDGKLVANNTANFMNKRFWLIVNLQMEGSSGSAGSLSSIYMKAKNIYVAAQPK